MTCDSELQLWDIDQLHYVRSMQGSRNDICISSISITCDGAFAASADWHGEVRIWNVTTGECIRTLKPNAGPSLVVPSADGRHLLSSGDDLRLKLSDVVTGEYLADIEINGRFDSLQLTSDGELAVSSGSDGTLSFWEIKDHQIRIRNEFSYVADRAAVTPDGRLALSIYHGIMYIWDVSAGHLIRKVEAAIKEASIALALTADGSIAVSGGRESGVLVWDIERGTFKGMDSPHEWEVTGLAFRPLHASAVSISSDKTLCVWPLEDVTKETFSVPATGALLSLDIARDGSFALIGCDNSVVYIWGLVASRLLHVLHRRNKGIRSARLTPDSRFAVASSGNGLLYFWDVARSRCLRVFGERDSNAAQLLVMTPDGRAVVAAHFNVLRLWELSSGRCIGTLWADGEMISALDINPEGRHVVSGHSDGMLRVWNLATSSLISEFKAHQGRVTSVSVDNCNRWIARQAMIPLFASGTYPAFSV